MPSRPRLAWMLCAPLTVWGAPLGAQQLVPVERARLAAAVWAEARYNAAGWDRVRADWDSALTAVLSAAPERQSDLVFFRRLRRFVALLHDGRAAVVPPSAIGGRWGRPPLMLRGIERRPFLVDYAENDELRVARPERNAEILAVQGIPAERWIRDSVLPEVSAATDATRWEIAVSRMLEGEKGTAIHLQLRFPGGEERGASVTRSLSLTEDWPLAPPPLQVDTLTDGIVWVRASSFADPDVARRFDRAFPDFARVRGLILDLREHEGTSGGRETGYRILGRLVSQPLITMRWRTPQYRPAYRGRDMPDSIGAWFEAPPDTVPVRTDLPVFTGPVAVLTSSRTGGAAEDLLVAFREAGRGPIVGQTTAGSAGQAGEFRLYKSWRLQLTVTRDAFPDGIEIQGRGIAPELPVTQKVSDFLAGRDATLERARDYVAGRLVNDPPHP
jgi:C-terminal processing protease CtpA/Prc